MQIWIVTAAALALLGAATPAGDLLHGQWQQDSTFHLDTIDGKAPPASAAATRTNSDRSCYSPEETRSIAGFLRAGAADECAGLSVTARGGKLNVSGSCHYGTTNFTVTGNGSYSAADFDLTIHGSGMANGHRVTMTARDTGHWLGSCPAAAGK
ncbi:MAG: DUF3617 domain-containing protein [Sphingomonas sp.]